MLFSFYCFCLLFLLLFLASIKPFNFPIKLYKQYNVLLSVEHLWHTSLGSVPSHPSLCLLFRFLQCAWIYSCELFGSCTQNLINRLTSRVLFTAFPNRSARVFIYFCFAEVKSPGLTWPWAGFPPLVYFLLIALSCLERLPFTCQDAVCFDGWIRLTHRVTHRNRGLFICRLFVLVPNLCHQSKTKSPLFKLKGASVASQGSLRAMLITTSGWRCVAVYVHSSLTRAAVHWTRCYLFTIFFFSSSKNSWCTKSIPACLIAELEGGSLAFCGPVPTA